MLSFLPPKVPMVELVGRPEAEMDPLSAIDGRGRGVCRGVSVGRRAC